MLLLFYFRGCSVDIIILFCRVNNENLNASFNWR